MGFFDRKLSGWDIGLVKLSVLAGVLFILTMWPAIWNAVVKVNPWVYLVVFVIIAIRPSYKYFVQK